jgi:NAD(P)-dependent dehydrogenase (short-subunit alcohol dehydrogenase family)
MTKRILLIGATGDIGTAVNAELAPRHEILTAGRTSGDLTVDLSDATSVKEMYAAAGPLDAVISTAGDVTFAPLADQSQDTFMRGLTHKVMGQVNLVLEGQHVLNDGGSFTLTGGALDRDPIPMGANAATANAALAGFATGAAIELKRGLRVNVVSPGLLDISVPRYGAWFPGHEPVTAARVGRAYAKSVEGALTGQVFIVE